MTRILVVCTANVCRSPVAQLLLQAALHGTEAVVESAGVNAAFGDHADPIMQNFARDRQVVGLDAHRARPVLPQMLRKYELVLCMERHHLSSVISMAPMQIGQIKLFGHWGVGEIPDPYKGTVKQYESALKSIEESALQWSAKLKILGMVS